MAVKNYTHGKLNFSYFILPIAVFHAKRGYNETPSTSASSVWPDIASSLPMCFTSIMSLFSSQDYESTRLVDKLSYYDVQGRISN